MIKFLISFFFSHKRTKEIVGDQAYYISKESVPSRDFFLVGGRKDALEIDSKEEAQKIADSFEKGRKKLDSKNQIEKLKILTKKKKK